MGINGSWKWLKGEHLEIRFEGVFDLEQAFSVLRWENYIIFSSFSFWKQQVLNSITDLFLQLNHCFYILLSDLASQLIAVGTIIGGVVEAYAPLDFQHKLNSHAAN